MISRSLAAVPLLVWCGVFLSAKVAEDSSFSLLIRRIEDHVKKNPQEKVHLHLDKPYYAIGENIWFKAYVLDARTSEPSKLSPILYGKGNCSFYTADEPGQYRVVIERMEKNGKLARRVLTYEVKHLYSNNI